MIRRPPRSTRTDTRFPYTTLFRSVGKARKADTADAVCLGHAAKRGRRRRIGRPQDDDRRDALGILFRDIEQIPVVGGIQGVELHAAAHLDLRFIPPFERSEERSVGKECVSKVSTRGSPYN